MNKQEIYDTVCRILDNKRNPYPDITYTMDDFYSLMCVIYNEWDVITGAVPEPTKKLRLIERGWRAKLVQGIEFSECVASSRTLTSQCKFE